MPRSTFILICEHCRQPANVLTKNKSRARFCSPECHKQQLFGKSLSERIEDSIERVTESGCWIWVKKTMPFGYGVIGFRYQRKLAHRASWEAFRGPIPRGMHVLHRCNIPQCVNPDHLYLGTSIENCRDRIAINTQFRIPPMHGERSPHAKVTDDIVLEIRRSKETCAALAARFSISDANVSAIRSHLTWKHVK
jgi:hypothetical protein